MGVDFGGSGGAVGVAAAGNEVWLCGFGGGGFRGRRGEGADDGF